MFRVLHSVVRQPVYLFIAGVVTFLVFTVSLFVPNAKLLAFGLGFDDVSLGNNLLFIFSFYYSLFSNFTPLTATLTVVTSLLFGVNAALLLYYIQVMRGGVREAKAAGALSLGGLVSGFFGIGCAACGSVIITSILSLMGAGGLLSLLPFGGQEFAFLAVALLLYSLLILTRRIAAGRICLTP